jgi:tetratricopeptide (TPR) repeat protein
MKFAKKLIPLALLGTLAVGGCQSGGKKELSQKEKAYNKWNDARGGVLFSLAKQQFEAGNLADARKTIDQAAGLSPENVNVRLLSARISIEQGRLDVALKELDEIRAKDPQNAEADYLTGVIYQRWQRPQEALRFYVQASEKAPSELAFVLARAEMLVAQGRNEQALDLLQGKLVYFENSGPIRDGVGQLLAAQGKHKEAVTVLRQAHILAPDDEGIREHLALAYFYAAEYRDAASLIERIVKEDRYKDRADLLTVLGESLLLTDRARDARENFMAAANLRPGDAHIWFNLGKVALELGDTRRAEMSVKKGLALEPNTAEGQLLLGYLRLKQEKLDDALAAFRSAGALDKNDTVSICMVGYVLEKQGKHADALREYGRALRLNPNEPMAATLMAGLQVNE